VKLDEIPEQAAAGRAGGLEDQRAQRSAKRELLARAGLDPYPSRFDRSATTSQLRERFGALGPDSHTGVTERVAGRLTAIRGHGKLVFATLRDSWGTIQLLCQLDRMAPPAATVVEAWDTGDWVGAEGEVVTSRRGELSIEVSALSILAKALRPPPDKWHGLADQDTRYRQREVDLLANEDARRVFDVRFKAVESLRRSLVREGFVEVETPILQPLAGGALARPFVTRANALDVDLTLRIAPELYLKRLVVGGYERVFEIARNFRNEGIDARHSPEFTALEAYQALGDAQDGMDRAENLIVEAATAATGRMTFAAGEDSVDLSPPWPRRDLLDMVEEVAGERLHPSLPVEQVRAACERLGLEFLEHWGSGKLIFEIYDKVLQPSIVAPTFVYGFPVEVSPLARQSRQDPTMSERFELVVAGRELANGYSELNDPDEQRRRFEAQAAAAASGDLEAHPADAAFVRALEYGLPPTSGIGIGVDRLVMLLAEVSTIRDVILFPALRPEALE